MVLYLFGSFQGGIFCLLLEHFQSANGNAVWVAYDMDIGKILSLMQLIKFYICIVFSSWVWWAFPSAVFVYFFSFSCSLNAVNLTLTFYKKFVLGGMGQNLHR